MFSIILDRDTKIGVPLDPYCQKRTQRPFSLIIFGASPCQTWLTSLRGRTRSPAYMQNGEEFFLLPRKGCAAPSRRSVPAVEFHPICCQLWLAGTYSERKLSVVEPTPPRDYDSARLVGFCRHCLLACWADEADASTSHETSGPLNVFRGVGCSERIASFAELRCGQLLNLDSLLWYIYKLPDYGAPGCYSVFLS
jgi:hypothetical protein